MSKTHTGSKRHGSAKRVPKRRADGKCTTDEDQQTCPCSRCRRLVLNEESLSDITEFEPMKKKVKPNEELLNVMFDVGYVESCLLAIANKSPDWNVYRVSDCDESPNSINSTRAKPLLDEVAVDLLSLTEIQSKDTYPNGLFTCTSRNGAQSIPLPREIVSYSNLEDGEQESSTNINEAWRKKQSVESLKSSEHLENPQPKGMVRRSSILNIKSWTPATNYMDTPRDMPFNLLCMKTGKDTLETAKSYSATKINAPSSMTPINNSCCKQEISSGSGISPGRCQNSVAKKETPLNKPSTSISVNAVDSNRLQEISPDSDISPVSCPTSTTKIIKETSPNKSSTFTSINTLNSCQRLQEKYGVDILLDSVQQTTTKKKKKKRKKKRTTDQEKPIESTPLSPVVMLVDYLLLLESCKTVSNELATTGMKHGSYQKLQSPTEKPGSVGYNFVNGNVPGSQTRTGLRPVIIDGSNVARCHTHGKGFSVRGLKICIDYFKDLGHDVIAFVPRYRSELKQSTDRKLLLHLEAEGLVIFTPSRWVEGSLQVSYDDRYTVQCASELGGVIVSTDNFRDLLKENPVWTKTINERLLQFTWVGNILIFPQDPQGRRGASLKELLRF